MMCVKPKVLTAKPRPRSSSKRHSEPAGRIQRIYPGLNSTRFDRIDHDYLWTAKAYQMRLALQKNLQYHPVSELGRTPELVQLGQAESATKHLIGS